MAPTPNTALVRSDAITPPMSGQRSDIRLTRQPQRSRPLMRRYEVAWLSPDGLIEDFFRLAPATPCFESAFAAFGRGTLIQTTDGPRAVEDLLPGDMIIGSHNGPQPLRWTGHMTMVPNAPGQDATQSQLTRVSADAFGLGRPMPDLCLGPAARLEHRVPDGLTRIGAERAFMPANSFADGSSVIEITPVAPVQVHHLALDKHDSVLANGLAVETFHPGRISELRLSDDLFALYLSMFPHVDRIADFGDMCLPRVTEADLRRAA